MKNSDVVHLYAESNIDPIIISDLERIQQRLMKLTDEGLATIIVENSLKVYNTHYSVHDKIEASIKEKYPNLFARGEKSSLFYLARELCCIISGDDKRIEGPLKHLPNETIAFYKEIIREKIEKKVIEIFYPGDIEGYEPPDVEMVVDEIKSNKDLISKSELDNLGPIILITRNMKREIKKNLDDLKIVLKDNPEFAELLVKKLFHVSFDKIEKLIDKEYPRLDCVDESIINNMSGEEIKAYYRNVDICYQISRETTTIMYELDELYCGDNKTWEKWTQLCPAEQKEYLNILHEEVRTEVNRIFFNDDMHDVDMIGEN